MIDFDFIEFYIKKKYKQKMQEYFCVTKGMVSQWRNDLGLPEKRLNEFMVREKSFDVKELFDRLY